MNKNIFKKIVFSILLLNKAISPLSALTNGNRLEIGTALATMFMDMTANHYAFTGNNKIANKLKCITDTLSLSSKSLFFYNHYESANPYDRDCLANGALMLRDVTKLAEHLYAAMTTQAKSTQDVGQSNDLDAISLNSFINFDTLVKFALEKNNQLSAPIKEKTQEQTDPKKSSFFDYVRKVIFLPGFKGLTALAVACTQDNATTYAGDHARFTATAVHSFAQLLEEYSNLSPDSKLQNPLLFALCVNVVWIYMESRQYVEEQKREELNKIKALIIEEENRDLAQLIERADAQTRRLGELRENQDRQDRTAWARRRRQTEELRVFRETDIAQARALDRFQDPVIAREPIQELTREAFRANTRLGMCVIGAVCDNSIATNLQVLGCGHAYCTECLNGLIGHAQTNRENGNNFDHIPCPHPECMKNHQYFTRDEIRCISEPKDEAARLELYDNHARERALARHHAPANADELAAVREALRNGPRAIDDDQEERNPGRLYICPGCNEGIARNGGCNHITCRTCRTEFCCLCMTRYVRNRKMCNCGLFDTHDSDDDNNNDSESDSDSFNSESETATEINASESQDGLSRSETESYNNEEAAVERAHALRHELFRSREVVRGQNIFYQPQSQHLNLFEQWRR
jgi:hypothetical protein